MERTEAQKAASRANGRKSRGPSTQAGKRRSSRNAARRPNPGLAASAVLVFIFSWTEFLLSLFLTTEIRTVPVKIQTFVTSTGNEWGFIAALGTAAIIPSFIFILLVQKNLVRGLTLGSLKE